MRRRTRLGVYSVHLGSLELARFYAKDKASARRKVMRYLRVQKER